MGRSPTAARILEGKKFVAAQAATHPTDDLGYLGVSSDGRAFLLALVLNLSARAIGGALAYSCFARGDTTPGTVSSAESPYGREAEALAWLRLAYEAVPARNMRAGNSTGIMLGGKLKLSRSR